ncbi:MAG: Gfo/Idh/MocA family oxidoreductase [Bacteroidetes bacterium]|nr:Gfo/Idh/MocA family oxidoreductase [Bacteroidota bacterium]MBS1756841.1 Gfo/Idh/MocA family oxidoreductase [Bacteroidota bacterium]
MKPTFAIIGCGRIARRHAEQIDKVGKLLAVCDIVPENAKELGKIYGAAVYTSAEELLANEPEVNIVSICSPNGLHATHAIACLQAQKHVLCEKPLAISTHDAKKMMEAATKNDRKLFVVKQNRYNPPVMAVKKLLENGSLGNILSFQINCFWNRPHEYYFDSWKGTKKLDGGSLFTQFSHFIDLLYWMLGDVKQVKSVIRNYKHPLIEIEDTGMVILEMLSGAIGTLNYTVNSYRKNMEGSFAIFGDKGTVKIGGQYLNEMEYNCIEGVKIENLAAGNPANGYGYYQGSMSNHDKVYENLVKAIEQPGYEFASAMDGMKTVEIIEKIYADAALK